jgi:predicted RNase H-like HicB family nuclease
MNRTYMVIYERVADDNWGGWVPDIGGAVGAGDSLDLARTSLREGISAQLEDLSERGLEAPAAKSSSVDFSEFDPDPSQSHYEVEWLTVDLSDFFAAIADRAQQAA